VAGLAGATATAAGAGYLTSAFTATFCSETNGFGITAGAAACLVDY